MMRELRVREAVLRTGATTRESAHASADVQSGLVSAIRVRNIHEGHERVTIDLPAIHPNTKTEHFRHAANFLAQNLPLLRKLSWFVTRWLYR